MGLLLCQLQRMNATGPVEATNGFFDAGFLHIFRFPYGPTTFALSKGDEESKDESRLSKSKGLIDPTMTCCLVSLAHLILIVSCNL